jgi:hypothetical protein
MKTEVSTYEQEAIDFLKKTNTTFACKFVKHGIHFPGDKETRDIYDLTLTRGKRSQTFRFGQSINASGQYIIKDQLRDKLVREKEFDGKYAFTELERKKLFIPEYLKKDIFKNPNFKEPAPYDLLACLTKYDPGTFEDFCDEFGYDEDSRSAERVYKSVVEEWKQVQSLFTDEEIEQLQEIQ